MRSLALPFSLSVSLARKLRHYLLLLHELQRPKKGQTERMRSGKLAYKRHRKIRDKHGRRGKGEEQQNKSAMTIAGVTRDGTLCGRERGLCVLMNGSGTRCRTQGQDSRAGTETGSEQEGQEKSRDRAGAGKEQQQGRAEEEQGQRQEQGRAGEKAGPAKGQGQSRMRSRSSDRAGAGQEPGRRRARTSADYAASCGQTPLKQGKGRARANRRGKESKEEG